MATVTMKALLEAGVHFGHRTRRWNPKMKPFIFTERNGIHIIDLQQTIVRLEQAYNLVRDTVAEGGTVLFVGTKKQAQENLAVAAQSCAMPYVNSRWLGGTLTNWQTIKQRISYLLELEQRRETGDFERLPKKEALKLEQLIDKLNRRLGGLKNMTRVPDLIFVVDVRREAIAVKEANILNIPVLAMVDTNCDPDPIDLVIPVQRRRDPRHQAHRQPYRRRRQRRDADPAGRAGRRRSGRGRKVSGSRDAGQATLRRDW